MLIYASVFMILRWFPSLIRVFRHPLLQVPMNLSDSVLRTHASLPFLSNPRLPIPSKLLLGSLAACGGGMVHRVLINVHMAETYSDIYLGALVTSVHLMMESVEASVAISTCVLINFGFLSWTRSSLGNMNVFQDSKSQQQHKAGFTKSKKNKTTISYEMEEETDNDRKNEFATAKVSHRPPRSKSDPNRLGEENDEDESFVDLEEDTHSSSLDTPRRSLRQRSKKST